MKKTLNGQVGDATGNCKSENFVIGVFGFVKKNRATADDAQIKGDAPPIEVSEVPQP
jgi:hypothetical protein